MKIFLSDRANYALLRITCYVLFCLTIFSVSASAQQTLFLEKRVSIQFKDITLSDALKQIEQQQKCSFVYSNKLLNTTQRVSRNYKNEKLGNLLIDLISRKGLKLRESGDQIFIGLEATGKQNVSGRITTTGITVPGASVSIGNLRTVTDADGKYILNGIANGTYTLKVSSVGLATISRPIILKDDESLTIDIELKTDEQQLTQVNVTGKTITQKIKETGFNVNTLEVGKFNNTTKDLNQILNTTTGVRIRETGGLGSDFNFSLNGLSGKAVRFFVDGIPMENYGIGMAFNNIPVNLAERMEVYKGVVPVELGADALGGAVNMVTNKGTKSYADASYSIGSFNTHRAALNAQYKNEATGLLLKLTGFYNYSDNDYLMRNNPKYDVLIQVPDGKGNFVQKDVRRFHDQYKSAMIKGEVGYVNKSWADVLMLGMLYNEHSKEFQTGSMQSAVYGRVKRTGDYVMPSLRYKKDNLFVKGLSASAFLSYGIDKYAVADTSTTTYWWDGSVKSSNNNHGEFGPSIPRSFVDYKNTFFLSRINLNYDLDQNNSIAFNQNYSSADQKANDRLGSRKFNPSGQSKSIFGLSWKNSAFDDKLKTTAFAKMYYFNLNLGEIVGGATPMGAQDRSYHNFGYGLASRYALSQHTGIRVSYEHAYRLPEQIEVLGDGVNVIPNPRIRPEKSHNYNLGVDFSNRDDKHYYSFDVSGFLRNATDFIYTIPAGNNSSQYLNEGKVIIVGTEAEAQYKYGDLLDLTVNASYQKSKQNQKYIYGTLTPRETYGNMIPNQPWLYGNLFFSVGKSNLLGKDTRLQFDWATQYFHSFFLTWEAFGSSQSLNVVPTQLLHNAGVTYSLKGGKYNVSFECKNLANELAYDNFRLQKPGRSVNLKLRYFIH